MRAPQGQPALFGRAPGPVRGQKPPKTSGTVLSLSRARSSRGFETCVNFKTQEMPPASPVRGELPGARMASSGRSQSSGAPRLRPPVLGRHKPVGSRHPSLRGAGRCPQAGPGFWNCGTLAAVATGDPSRAPCSCRIFTFTAVKFQ